MHKNIIDNFKWVKATWVESGDFRQLWATSGNLALTHPHRTNKIKHFWQSLRSMIQTFTCRIQNPGPSNQWKLQIAAIAEYADALKFPSASKTWAKLPLIPRPIPPLCKIRIENQQKDNKNLSKGRVLRDVEDLHGLHGWTSLFLLW